MRLRLWQSYPSPLARFSPPPWHPRRAEEVVVAVMLVVAVAVVPAAAVGAEAVPAVAGGPAMVRVGAAGAGPALGPGGVGAGGAVPAMGGAGVVGVDGVTIIAAMAGAAMAFT